MPEHRIRLRAGWQRLEPRPEGGFQETKVSSPVTLPLLWPSDQPDRSHVRLGRYFASPRLDAQSESLLLRMERVCGLVSVVLNHREIGRLDPGETRADFIIPHPIPHRNLLILDVEPRRAGSIGRELWGIITLVIVSKNPGEDHESLGGTEPRA
jgi:hypothetical protein